MMDIFEKIEARFGDLGLVVSILLTVLCILLVIGFWMFLVAVAPEIGLPLPFLALGFMIYAASKGSNK
jgi:hypothetical protein